MRRTARRGTRSSCCRAGTGWSRPSGRSLRRTSARTSSTGSAGWSRAEVVSAVKYGTAPDGGHYYPAFPYAAYGKATMEDLVSLAAFLETLPASPAPSQPHELSFPYSIRAGVGAWKLLFAGPDWVMPAPTPEIEAGPVSGRGARPLRGVPHAAECAGRARPVAMAGGGAQSVRRGADPEHHAREAHVERGGHRGVPEVGLHAGVRHGGRVDGGGRGGDVAAERCGPGGDRGLREERAGGGVSRARGAVCPRVPRGSRGAPWHSRGFWRQMESGGARG